jgi:hypothetical protein
LGWVQIISHDIDNIALGMLAYIDNIIDMYVVFMWFYVEDLCVANIVQTTPAKLRYIIVKHRAENTAPASSLPL